MGIVLQAGKIVTDTACYQADIRIQGEIIAAVGSQVRQAGDTLLSAAGCYIFPGGIDAHTHFDLPVGAMSTADDFASGTKAAILGGTTTVIDYATQFKGETLKQGLENWHQRAGGKCYADYGFHMAITDWNDNVSREIFWLSREAGVSSVKLYMAYKNVMQVDDNALFQVLDRSRECSILTCVHCENGDIVDNLIRKFRQQGKTTPAYHPLSRPPRVEQEAVNRLMVLAEMADAPVLVVHLSCREALETVAKAKERGVQVFAETCPQYLVLDDSRYQDTSFSCAKYVISPPLRGKENQEYLWNGLKTGILDTVATDHCSFNFHGQKEVGRGDFSKIPNGAPGVEHRLGLLYTYGVKTGKISLTQFVDKVATQPAKLFGLFPKKGTIAPGSDADLVIWDEQRQSTIGAATHAHKVDYSPYEGMKQQGQAIHVFLRGQQVVNNGKVCTDNPNGQYLFRKPFQNPKENTK
ncbi:dihydropyrimidinase [Sporomusa sp. KB1]|jgi:dihydropyrimidinase|uniref:dihydropyrimidinase n=1 Tax=Sporomusa sp. KB1 TaxID=943346 RepID=UPI0011A248F5|nr:dihydropyrimidinase [Sporomusa sp. KB1]TWH44943.1 dihydropyrimidinase [Sporomusa sp. KB1]